MILHADRYDTVIIRFDRVGLRSSDPVLPGPAHRQPPDQIDGTRRSSQRRRRHGLVLRALRRNVSGWRRRRARNELRYATSAGSNAHLHPVRRKVASLVPAGAAMTVERAVRPSPIRTTWAPAAHTAPIAGILVRGDLVTGAT